MSNSPPNGGVALASDAANKQTQMGIFAKYWQPGRVKTRLAAAVGAEVAADIYRRFVETLLQRFDSVGGRRVLCFWPPEFEPEMKRAGEHWMVNVQSAGDLGQRMQTYFDEAFAAGQQRVVLIGSDSPNLPRERIDDAFQLLTSSDVVLGPTPDGGYYLIGMSRRCPEVFADVPWSTAKVWERTMDNVRRANLRHAVLKPWYDVDEIEDLHQLQRDLATATEPELTRLRDDIARALQQSVASDG